VIQAAAYNRSYVRGAQAAPIIVIRDYWYCRKEHRFYYDDVWLARTKINGKWRRAWGNNQQHAIQNLKKNLRKYP
jgi:hypothetical protein